MAVDKSDVIIDIPYLLAGDVPLLPAKVLFKRLSAFVENSFSMSSNSDTLDKP